MESRRVKRESWENNERLKILFIELQMVTRKVRLLELGCTQAKNEKNILQHYNLQTDILKLSNILHPHYHYS